MSRVIALALGLAALLATAGCDRPTQIEAHPALWRVRDADTTIWLLGTIHVLPSRVHWRTQAVDRAIETSDTLVTEIPQAPLPAQAATFLKLARARGLPPLLDRVPANQRALIERAAGVASVPLSTLNGMKSWAAAVTIAIGASRASGASASNGVEAALFDAFDKPGKTRRAFETLTGQLGLFDALAEDQQRLLLVRSAAGAVSAKAGYRATLDAWAAGDEQRIAASFDPAFKGAPALEAALLTGRNARWAAWIAQRMDRPGTVLVTVGAGHLAGAQSVVTMLRDRGLQVERVE